MASSRWTAKNENKNKNKRKKSKAMLVVVVAAVTLCELRGPIECARGEVVEGRRGGEGVARACSIANSNLAGSSSNSSRQVDQL